MLQSDFRLLAHDIPVLDILLSDIVDRFSLFMLMIVINLFLMFAGSRFVHEQSCEGQTDRACFRKGQFSRGQFLCDFLFFLLLFNLSVDQGLSSVFLTRESCLRFLFFRCQHLQQLHTCEWRAGHQCCHRTNSRMQKTFCTCWTLCASLNFVSISVLMFVDDC